MLSILVDTELLSCPKNPSETEANGFVALLRSLEAGARHADIRLLISSQAWHILNRAGALPPWGPSPFDYYMQDADVTTMWCSFIDRCAKVEELCGVSELILEDERVDKDFHLKSHDAELRRNYFDLLAIFALHGLSQGRGVAQVVVLSRYCTPPLQVLFSGQITMSWPSTVVSLPVSVSETFPHMAVLGQLSACVDPTEMLLGGARDCALRCATAARFEENGDWLSPMPPYTVHKAFWSSVENLGLFSNRHLIEKLIRACVDALLNVRLEKVHALRTGSGGDDPTRVRPSDGAEAQRRDVDYEYHLHYWKNGSAIEFASVVTHNDFSIPI